MKASTELKVELYRRGNYELLGLFDKQLQALEALRTDEVNEVLYGGAARGGKSYLLCLWKIMNRLAFHGSHGLIARDEMTKLKDTTQKTFFMVCDDLGLVNGFDYKFTGGKDVNFANGSREMFRDLKHLPVKDPEFDRLGSYDLTDCAIDEAQQIFWKAPQILKGRYSVLTGKNEVIKNGVKTYEEWSLTPKAFYSCNPKKNWIYTDFYKPWKNGNLSRGRVFIPALPKDNPHVKQSYIDSLMTADDVTKQRLLLGNFDYDDDPHTLCSWDAICDLFTNDHIPIMGRKRISADLAMQGRDKFIAGHSVGNVIYIDIDIAKSTGRSIEMALKQLKTEEQVPNSSIVADIDGLGNYLESYITNIKAFRGGARAMNGRDYSNLKAECAFKLAELINKRELFIICTKDQEEAIKQELSLCLKRNAIDKDETKKQLISKEEMKAILGHSPDYMDFLIMLMIFWVKKTTLTVSVR